MKDVTIAIGDLCCCKSRNGDMYEVRRDTPDHGNQYAVLYIIPVKGEDPDFKTVGNRPWGIDAIDEEAVHIWPFARACAALIRRLCLDEE